MSYGMGYCTVTTLDELAVTLHGLPCQGTLIKASAKCPKCKNVNAITVLFSKPALS
jgi:hypothetical protein